MNPGSQRNRTGNIASRSIRTPGRYSNHPPEIGPSQARKGERKYPTPQAVGTNQTEQPSPGTGRKTGMATITRAST